MINTRLVVSGLLIVSGCGVASAQGSLLSAKNLSIESQPLDRAINVWAEQTGYQVLMPSQLPAGRRAALVEGFYTPEGALKVLLATTDLEYQFVNSRTVAIRVADTSGTSNRTQESTTRVASSAERASLRSNEAGGASEKIAEVVVTAQKREERLIDTPQSVSVVSSEALGKLGATQLADFANTVAGLSFATTGAGNNAVFLRGVTLGASPSVAVYMDEVPYGSSSVFADASPLDVALFDVERIEVLRGPQGTLYGASTMGGLLKYVSKLPDPSRFGVDVRTGISDTHDGGLNYNVAAVANVPVADDKAALRVSGFESHDDGYIDNVAHARKDVSRFDAYGGRVDFLLKPSDALTIRIGAFAQNISRDGEATTDYTFAGAPQYGELGQFRKFSEPYDGRFRLGSITAAYDFGSATLTSISSYQSVRSTTVIDASAIFVPALGPFLPTLDALAGKTLISTDKFAQEVRLAGKVGEPLEWVVGGFYTHESSEKNQFFLLRDTSGQEIPNFLFTFFVPSRFNEYAGFADLTWHFSEKFDVTGGVRYAQNDQKFKQVGTGVLGLSAPDTNATSDVLTYLANARYHFNSHATGYVRYATGYRPGGPNIVTIDVNTGLPQGPAKFDPDKLKSYEVGFKAESADRRFGIDVAGYYIDWSDIQISAVSPGGFGTILNAPGGATVRGVELTLTGRPSSQFTFTGAFAYQNAKLSETEPALGGDKGERLPNVPKFTGAVTADYELTGARLKPTVGAAVRYVSDQMVGFGTYRLPSYTTVDLRSGLTFGQVDAQLYVRNLFDERGQLSIATPQFGARVAIQQPRTIGINVTTRF